LLTVAQTMAILFWNDLHP